MFRYLPEQASDFAAKIDWLNYLITDISVFFTALIVGSMLYFAIRYRRKDGVDHETPQIKGNHILEIFWSVVPTIIIIVVAYYGVIYYRETRKVPDKALNINVRAQKWKWDFEYDPSGGSEGKKTTGNFVVPVDQPVKLVMRSADVLHSFFIPSMRVKKDVIPGQYTYVWFRPIKTGTYQVYCTEYCGKDHSQMLATVRVVSGAEYERWLTDRSEELALKGMSPAKRGAQLFSDKGCVACHSLDGSKLVGPSFLKLFGREGKLAEGSAYKADENYIQKSIYDPNAQIVEGFPPNLMPNFTGQLSEDDIGALIAFIKTIDGSQPVAAAAPKKVDAAALAAMTPAERGKKVYDERSCAGCHSLTGAVVIGPSFKGIYGKKGKLADGSEYEANEEYIKKSILEPQAQIVEGFAATAPMPPFKGILSDSDIADVIEFFKTLK